MTKRNIVPKLFLCVLAIALLTACQAGEEKLSAPPVTSPPVITAGPTPPPVPIESPDPMEELLARMTVEEKVGQLLIAGIEGGEPGPDAEAAISTVQPGGIILFRRNVQSVEQLTALTDQLKEMNRENPVPLFLCVDEEGGLVSRMPDELADLPDMYEFGQKGDPALTYAVGRVLADLCRNQGINMNFAPVLDVWSNPGNTVIGRRAFGPDPETVAAMGLPVMEGLRDYGVIPVVKHFPGHGDTLTDSHEDLPVVEKSLEELLELELKPFAAAIADGAEVVMAAHVLERGIDPDLPASLSPRVIDGLLRKELGFEGVVCTDDLTMAAVSGRWSMGEAAVLAVEAGCDLLLVCHGGDNLTQARQGLLDAVGSGRVSAERLDESVRRILTLKEAYGLADEPAPGLDAGAANEVLTALLSGFDS
ncbi:MAG: beta-N-acetylhexosaminidase [Oscillospiraceae bacterium]|nr:beta-N-acetylhexosaminidase [Oscillospiraceae bacterium]